MYLFWHVVYWPCLDSPTPSRIYLSSHWQQGITCHVVPLLHVVSWPCLTSPTRTRIYLFPLWAIWNDASHSTPFACGLFGPMGSNLTHTLKDLPVSCKVGSLQPGFSSQRRSNHKSQRCHHKDRVITNIIAQGQTYIKSSQVKCIQNI